MQRYVILAVCILFLSATQARAEFYRWVDNDGKEFFTNDPLKVPPEYRGSAMKMEPDESRVSVEEKPAITGKTRITGSEHKDKYGRGEKYWRKRAADLRGKLRDQEVRYDLVLKEQHEQDQKPKTLNGKKTKARASLEKKKAKLETERARTRRALEVNLPEEARKADAYPGWLRE